MKNLSMVFFTLIICVAAFAQSPYKVKMTEPVTLKGKEHAYTKGIIGENKDNIFILLDQTVVGDGQLSIVSYNKKNMTKDRSVNLFTDYKEAKNYTLTNYYPTKDGFIFFFETEKKNVVNVYATTVDHGLKIKDKLNPIFEFNSKEMDVRFLQAEGRNDFVMISQKFVEEGEEIMIEYFLYDQKFKPKHDGKISTGLYSTVSLKKASRRSFDNLSDFRLSDNGDLIGLTYTRADKNDKFSGYYQLGFTNVETGNTQTFPIELKDAFFDEYTLIINDGALVISGFYQDRIEKDRLLSDNKKVKSSRRINGTFFRRYDLNTYELLNSSQIMIDEVLANKIANGNPATRGGLFKAEKDDTDLSSRYNITDVIFDPETKRANIYCEYKYNYSTTSSRTVNGVTTTTTTYHSVRGNLFYFQISLEDGSITWYENIRKYSHFQGSSPSVYYMISTNVIPGKTKDYVFYLTSRFFDENNPDDLKGEKFKAKKVESAFITAVVNRENGRNESYKPEMVESKLKKHETTDFSSIYRSDEVGVIYTINASFKLKIMKSIFASYIALFNRKVLNKLSDETYTISQVTLNK